MGTEDTAEIPEQSASADEQPAREPVSEQPATQPVDDGDSVVDLAQQSIVVDWIKYVTALFAAVGLGYGLFDLLADVVDEQIIEVSGQGLGGFDAAFSFSILSTPYVAITAAVFVGAFLGWKLSEDDTTTFLAAGLSALVGTLAFWVLAAFMGTVPMDDVSIDFGGLLITAIVAGVAAAVAAVGGVWASRNLAPATLESAPSTAEGTVAPADD